MSFLKRPVCVPSNLGSTLGPNRSMDQYFGSDQSKDLCFEQDRSIDLFYGADRSSPLFVVPDRSVYLFYWTGSIQGSICGPVDCDEWW